MDDRAAPLPLEGLRVLELGIGIAAPVAARNLAHFGADVIRVESRRRPDSPRQSGAGWVISTRRGIADSLVDLGRWGIASGKLNGKVSIVAMSGARPEVDAAVEDFRRLGVTVARVAYLDPAPADQPQISTGVLDFAGSGVEVVLFAAPVDQQNRWASQQAIVQPVVRYVVSGVARRHRQRISRATP